ncbi:MAG: class I SAM-dependent methyltransferase [Verrucomicrobiia bacterium]
MTFELFNEIAMQIAREAGVVDSHHGYFLLHSTRLYKTHLWFNTFNRKLGKTLEIGPLYSYTPFILRQNVETYDILEGDEPGVKPMLNVYENHKIPVKIIDLGLEFGNPVSSKRHLPYQDAQFDSIICWETIEHFNFNPVPFIRELKRVLKPGGAVFLTVPNRASADSIFNLLSGRGQIEHIEEFLKYADFERETGHTCFFYHWHEYTMREFKHLLQRCGFSIEKAGYIMEFQDKAGISISRRLIRSILKTGSLVFPSLGNHLCVLCRNK